MNETNTQNGAADAIKAGAQNAYTNGKAAFEQVTTKSKETIEQGMKSLGFVGTKPNPYRERSTVNLHYQLSKYMGTGEPQDLTLEGDSK